MPELPEVETIVRMLGQGDPGGGCNLINRQIISSLVLWPRVLAEPTLVEFSRRIGGQVVKGLGRRAKFILIFLTQDTLLIHLRMSGDLRLEPEFELNGTQNPILKHDRLVLSLEGNCRLVFNDTRKFGRTWLLRDSQSILSKLGPEPLDESFTPDLFWKSLLRHRRQIKPLLMDQTFLAGMGNIYTDEALFFAGIHPLTLASNLSEEQVYRLWSAIRSVLQEGIRRNGASIDWVYRGGEFQNQFMVYQRTGEKCYTCGETIQRAVIGQRSTHFCPNCQPRK